jgi:hypothetical protein
MIVNELKIDEVERLVEEVSLQSMFALPWFVKALAIQRPFRFLHIQTTRNEFLVSIVLDSFRLRGLRIYNNAISFSPPQPLNIHVSSQDVSICLEKTKEYICNTYACKELSIIQYPHDPPLLNGIPSLEKWHIMDEGQDLFLDLSIDLPTLYYSMAKRHRYVLRKITGLNNEDVIEIKPEKLTNIGYRLEIGNDIRNLRDFYSLWMITFKKMKKQLSKERIHRVAESFKFENYARSIDILSSKGLCNIFLLYKGDTPLCGAVLYMSNNFLRVKQSYWSAGASTQVAKKLGAPLLLQWMIIKWLKEKHYMKYFLGGLDPDNPYSGPTLFKMGFGGSIIKGKRAIYRDAILRYVFWIGHNLYTRIPMKQKITSSLLKLILEK